MEICKLIHNDSEVLTGVLCVHIAYAVGQVCQHVVSLTSTHSKLSATCRS